MPDPAPASAPPGGAVGGDIARHAAVVDPGPRPVTRAVSGVLLGLACGAVVALLTPRDADSADPAR